MCLNSYWAGRYALQTQKPNTFYCHMMVGSLSRHRSYTADMVKTEEDKKGIEQLPPSFLRWCVITRLMTPESHVKHTSRFYSVSFRVYSLKSIQVLHKN